jgi:hypothetical protein
MADNLRINPEKIGKENILRERKHKKRFAEYP